ncbi:MAG: sensor histidine kinase [Rhodomicrobium sp.]
MILTQVDSVSPSAMGEAPSIELDSLDALLRVAFESAPNGMVITSAAGVILHINAEIEHCFGYARGDLVGRSIEALMPHRFREAHRTHLSSFVAENRVRQMGAGQRLLAMRKDGSEFTAEIGLRPVKLKDGVVILASIIDISERIAKDAALRDSEERLRAVIENVVDGVITIDEAGVMQSVNPATERMFGYSAAELIGRNVALLMPEPDRSRHDAYIVNYRRTGRAKIIGIGREVTGRRKDGSTFPMDLAVSEFHVGNVRYFSGLIRDITARKEAEAEIKYYAEALRAQNAELQRSNQELDDFAYIASHDLKEPLRGIHNYCSFLIEDHEEKLDADGQAKLRTVMRLAQRLEDLIDSLLMFSRVGRVDLAIQETNLDEIVKEVRESLAIALEERGVEMRVPRPLPTLRCDKVRVAEVFRNLISNAIKYNDKPVKWIEVGYEAQAFYVSDNGIGVREKHLDAIFRIFKRLHARDKYGGGTGMGLSIVKKIVERHGGRIWVESKFGEGSRFNFTLGQEK